MEYQSPYNDYFLKSSFAICNFGSKTRKEQQKNHI